MDLKIKEDVAEKTLNRLMNTEIKRKDSLQFSKTLVQQRWEILDRLGSGGFGLIYKAYDKVMKDLVAIKVEKRPDKSDLSKEVSYYTQIEKYSMYIGLPKFSPSCRWFGKEDKLNLAVFDLMGPSLSDLFYNCGKRFSLKTVLMLADQMIDRLDYVHQCGLIHGDVKPGNFVMGINDCDRILYIIDFGLSNYWRDKNGNHIPYKSDCAFKGTYRYASINSHFKFEQSRRDDLESLGYVLIYFLKGVLPWQNLKISKNERRKVIGSHKEKVSLEILTENLPNEFFLYMSYIRKLPFSEMPDYQWLKDLFRSCMWRFRLNYDRIYDWNQTQQFIYPTIFKNNNFNNNIQMHIPINNLVNDVVKDAPKEVISISTTDNNMEDFKQCIPTEVFSDKLPPIISPSSSSMTLLSPCTTLSSPCTTLSFANNDDDIINSMKNNIMNKCESQVCMTSSPPPMHMNNLYFQFQNYSTDQYTDTENAFKKRKRNDGEQAPKRMTKYSKENFLKMYNNVDK